MDDQEEFEVEKIMDKRILNGEIQYRLKYVGFSARYNTWEPMDNMSCDELIFQYEKQQALKVLAVTFKDGEWMYLIQFKNAPRLRFERASQFYADLIFDFLVGKIKYDSFTQDSGAMINILSETDVLHGPPEIVYVTDFVGGIHFCLKYQNGYKFESASYVKENFVELAVAYLEQNLEME